ncbi:heterokaryon incompatibility protein-domain-containing protein [Xylariaceae sp. FL1272]|nr:heterokaryon incompatibility protein-domain-containing protein [Xylariaceae sp. FL1272]
MRQGRQPRTCSDSAVYLKEFESKVNSQLVQSAFSNDEYFLPDRHIASLINEANLKRLLPKSSDSLLGFIRNEAPRLFLSVVMSDVINRDTTMLLDVLMEFQDMSLTDGSLPIEDISKRGRCKDDSINRTDTSLPARCFHDPALEVFHQDPWDYKSFKAFYATQWMFMAPVFKKQDVGRSQKELPYDAILPFTWIDPKIQSGHFSEVYHAHLHAEHQNELRARKGDNFVHVAVKKLKNNISDEPSHDVEAAWHGEVTTLNELSGLPNAHLIRRINAFKWRSHHYIVFEWASGGNLRQFWKKNHKDLSRQTVMEFLHQLCGIAGALKSLHQTNNHTATGLAEANSHQRSPKLLSPRRIASRANKYPDIVLPPDADGASVTQHWRHGDLKPENILVFSDESWLGTLKIADLGLAKKHNFATEFRPDPTSTNHTTLHYEAPEVILNNRNEPRSRRYDIWSMGCIILESVIWLLYGSEVLDAFYAEGARLRNRSQQTLYFTTSSADGGVNLTAEVSEIATRWIRHILENDPECSRPTVVRELLELVRDKLLVVALPRSWKTSGPIRIDALNLHKKLDAIRRAAEADDTYLCTGFSRIYVNVPRPQAANTLQTMPYRPNPQALFDTKWKIVKDRALLSQPLLIDCFNDSTIFPSKSVICKRCARLDFHSPDKRVLKIEYGSLKTGRQYCQMCCLLFQASIRADKRGPGDEKGLSAWKLASGSVYYFGKHVLSIHKGFSPNSSVDGLGVSVSQSNIPFGLPRLPETNSSLYIKLLCYWLRDCDDNHTGCRPDPATARLPTRLVDVGIKASTNIRLRQPRLWKTEQPGDFRYVALSHPWGPPSENEYYCTTRRNIRDHERGISIDDLPKTFRDAIIITREIGVQYIWIDSLCIIQGDGSDFDEEAKHMETIFSSAYCVIAASRAKGMCSGFLHPRKQRKVVRSDRSNKSPVYVCEAIDDFQHDVIEGSLNKRGWVLQERALARRTIYFAERQTYWECGEGIRCETMTRMTNNQAALLGDPKFPKFATESTKGGQIRIYELLYKLYSRLEFTNTYDRPLAIAGIEQRLIRAFNTQGGYGVFNLYFGRSLLWKRDAAFGTQAMKPIQFPQSHKYRVPSWSWMAYEGAITFVDLPFKEVVWEEKEIQSPWAARGQVTFDMSPSSSQPESLPSTAWHTANGDERSDLTAVARDFSADGDQFLTYDAGRLPSDRTVKCVIVGRKKLLPTADATKQTHYVLVVAQVPGTERGNQYVRVGVGSLQRSFITNGSGIKVQIF